MMRPPPCLTIWRAAAWQQKKTPLRLTRSTRCHSASGCSRNGAECAMPALANITSRRPELADHPIHEVPHLARVAHVHADGEGPAAARDDLLGHRLGAGDDHVAEGHRRALGREQAGGRAPDAERAAGDRGDPSLQAHAAASILACLKTEEAGMKAIVFTQTGGPEVLALGDVPKPDVRPGMALIKIQAIGVNFADTRFRQGTYV